METRRGDLRNNALPEMPPLEDEEDENGQVELPELPHFGDVVRDIGLALWHEMLRNYMLYHLDWVSMPIT